MRCNKHYLFLHNVHETSQWSEMCQMLVVHWLYAVECREFIWVCELLSHRVGRLYLYNTTPRVFHYTLIISDWETVSFAWSQLHSIELSSSHAVDMNSTSAVQTLCSQWSWHGIFVNSEKHIWIWDVLVISFLAINIHCLRRQLWLLSLGLLLLMEASLCFQFVS